MPRVELAPSDGAEPFRPMKARPSCAKTSLLERLGILGDIDARIVQGHKLSNSCPKAKVIFLRSGYNEQALMACDGTRGRLPRTRAYSRDVVLCQSASYP